MAHQVEASVDRALLRGHAVSLVGPDKEALLPPVPFAAGEGGQAPVGDPGDTLAAVHPVVRQTLHHHPSVGGDAARVELDSRNPGGGHAVQEPAQLGVHL
jgi:ribulose kinase